MGECARYLRTESRARRPPYVGSGSAEVILLKKIEWREFESSGKQKKNRIAGSALLAQHVPTHENEMVPVRKLVKVFANSKLGIIHTLCITLTGLRTIPLLTGGAFCT